MAGLRRLRHLDRHLGAAATGARANDLAVGDAEPAGVDARDAQRAGALPGERRGMANDRVRRVGTTLAGREDERTVAIARRGARRRALHLGIARNILADRLRKLVANGILSREPKSADDRGFDHRLTEKGRDLWPVLTALRLWGDEWIYGPGKEALIVRDRGRDLQPGPAAVDG